MSSSDLKTPYKMKITGEICNFMYNKKRIDCIENFAKNCSYQSCELLGHFFTTVKQV